MKNTFLLLTILLLCAYALDSRAQSTLPDPMAGPPTSSHNYYENHGQIIDQNGNPQPSIQYYSNGSGEQLFFAANKIHHTLRIPGDSVGGILAPDTMVRLDVRFDCLQWRESQEQPCGEMNVYDQSDDFLNYFLPHCGPTGITGVQGWKTVAYNNAFQGMTCATPPILLAR